MAVNSVTPAQQADITALYAAFWNRAPDTTGFGYWVKAYSEGMSYNAIANEFRIAPEGVAAYPLASTNAQLITEVYQNVFDRAPDAGGLAFWTNALNTMTFPNVVISMVQAALKPGNDDGVLFANKVQVGEYVAITVETDNYNVTSHAFDLVTADPASVDEAEAWVDSQVVGATYTLTTSADIATAQYFDGSLNSFGLQTLQNFDQLTGQREVNKLDAQIVSGYYNSPNVVSAYVTPELLKNIQIVDVTVTPSGMTSGGYSYTYDTGATLDLRNADSVEVVVNDGSSAALTFNNVGGTLTDVAVNNTSAATTVNLANGANLTELNLNVSNVMGGATITVPTAETVNINSHTLASNVTLALADATTLVIDGDADLTASLAAVTNEVTSVDASLLEGDLNLTFSAQTGVLLTTDITVVSGLGDDTINMSSVAQDYNVTLGAGDDTLIDTGITDNDSVTGGLGYDTLSTEWDAARALTTVNGINGMDELIITDIVDTTTTLTAATVDSTITTVSLAATAGALSSAQANIVGSAGTFTVNLGTSEGTPGSLGDALSVTDTGSATTDTLNINNLALDTDDTTNVDVFAGYNVSSNGYENVVINTGAGNNASGNQDIGTLAIAADSTSAAVSLTVNGTNGLDITSLTSNSTGLLTVNASGMNVLTTGAGLTIAGTTLTTIGTAKGTQSITGSAGVDSITVGNWAATVLGGTGSDIIVGGTQADWLQGDAGNDTLTGSGGNDTILGGDGNDTIDDSVTAGNVSIDGGAGNDIVSIGALLNSSDVISGGIAGVDTLSVTTTSYTASDSIGVTNFEVLKSTVSQTMTNFYNNAGWTTVYATGTGSVSFTNALAAVTTFQIDGSATTETFARLVDTGTDSLTYQTTGTAANLTTGTLNAVNEESLTIDVSNGTLGGAGNLIITTLNADDLATLTLVGDHNVTISNAIGNGTHLSTVNASGLTGTVDVDASTSTTALTFTGATDYANIFISGSGNDTLTGGSANDTITGNAGNDTVTLGNGADTFIFGDQGTAVSGVATIAQAYARVGSDTIVNFVTGSDKLSLSEQAFGTSLIEGSTLSTTQFALVNSTTALITSAAGGNIALEGFVAVQSAANAAVSLYYVDTAVTAATQSVDSLILGGHAVLIGTLQSVSGTIAATDFLATT